jgi:hypothetical protein
MLGITYTFRLLGPTLGFLLGSYCLKTYVQPSINPGFEEGDPRCATTYSHPCHDFSNVFAKKIGEKMDFLLNTKLNYTKNDHNIGFLEERNFFAENYRKSLKILIKTSTPD